MMLFPAKLRFAAAVMTTAAVVAGATVQCAAADEAAPATAPALDAKFIKMDPLPKKLLTGQVFRVAITMKNTGTRSWGPAIKDHSVLRPQAPRDNTTWRTHFITQGQGTNCKPGSEFTYASYLKAPARPGEYVFQWRVARMDRGSYKGPATPFGEATPRAVVKVEKRPEEPRLPAPPAQDPSEKRVLGFDDFEYVGSFRIPDRAGQDLPFSHSGLALRKMKDGTKRMFFNYTLPGMVLVEVEIPALVKLSTKRSHAALKIAKVTKDWGKLTVKTPRIAGHDLKEIFPRGGFWWDDERSTLYWTWWHSYWCGAAPPVLAASKLTEDGQVTNYGPWFVGGNFKWYWGGVIPLPKDFARKYTGGNRLALGFGTGYSGTYAGSLGPSLGAIARPDPKTNTVATTPLLGYYKGDSAPRDGGYFLAGGSGWMGKQPDSPTRGYCGSGDLVRNGIFIDTPTKHGFIAFYLQQMGRVGYDYGAGTAAGYANWWYFYDPKDMGAVAKGLKKPGQVVPRSRTNVTLAGGLPLSYLSYIAGSCFDEEENLLYVYGVLSKGSIHAYRVKDAGGARQAAGDRRENLDK